MAVSAAQWGLLLVSDVQVEDEFFLWPENVGVFNFWNLIQTQWRVEDGRRSGLDYDGVRICLENSDLRKRDRKKYFWLLQAMEFAAIEEWDKQR